MVGLGVNLLNKVEGLAEKAPEKAPSTKFLSNPTAFFTLSNMGSGVSTAAEEQWCDSKLSYKHLMHVRILKPAVLAPTPTLFVVPRRR